MAYINNINVQSQPTFSLTFYLILGSLADVNSGLAALIKAYPPPAPIIAYPNNSYTFAEGTAIPNIFPSNQGGGPIAGYSISPNLTNNTDLAFNSTTGEISGTPNLISSGITYSITANGPGGNSSPYGINIAVVVAVPFDIINNSNNSIEYNFNGINGTSATVSGTCDANSGSTPDIGVPTGTYQVVISPAESPVNCDMLFNTGESANNTPGHIFSSINVSNSASTTLRITNP